MRHHGRMPCIAALSIDEQGMKVIVKCQKDGRHNRGNKRRGVVHHRVDIGPVKITWAGEGILSPEDEALWKSQKELYKQRRVQKVGELTWDGHEC